MGGELVVLKHADEVGPGWFLDRIVDRVRFFRVLKVQAIEDLPPPNECNGVIFAAHSLDPEQIKARDPFVREQLVFVRTLVGLGVPYLGIDGGAQLLACALGGKLQEQKSGDAGHTMVQLNAEGEKDPLFGGLGDVPAVSWPTHRFSLPRRALPLAGSAEAPDLFRLGEWTYGVVPHIQATPLMFTGWLKEAGGDLEVADEGALVNAVEANGRMLRDAAFRLAHRFIERSSNFCHVEPAIKDDDLPVLH